MAAHLLRALGLDGVGEDADRGESFESRALDVVESVGPGHELNVLTHALRVGARAPLLRNGETTSILSALPSNGHSVFCLCPVGQNLTSSNPSGSSNFTRRSSSAIVAERVVTSSAIPRTAIEGSAAMKSPSGRFTVYPTFRS